jgi:rare lipoprotein A (peptidoglycan hydrolase)
MAGMNFLKKVQYWPVVFLCLLFVGSVQVSFSDRSECHLNSENIPIIGRDMKDFYVQSALMGRGNIGWLITVPAVRKNSWNMMGNVTASWYGEIHHNKLTASGRIFNMYQNMLAHKTLPLGTKVRLVNPVNGKSAEGVVNDRGPYVRGRDVDVSYEMARQLGFVNQGVIRLELNIIESGGNVGQSQ